MVNFSRVQTIGTGSALPGPNLFRLFDFIQWSESVTGEETRGSHHADGLFQSGCVTVH